MSQTATLQARPPLTASPVIVLRVGDVDQPVTIDFSRHLESDEALQGTPIAESGLTVDTLVVAVGGKTVSMEIDAGDVAGRFRVEIAAVSNYDNRHIGILLVEVKA